MTEANDTAFPVSDSDRFHATSGLSKREYFAAMAMQGMLANPMLFKTKEHVEFVAVRYADALTAALNAVPKS